MSTTAARRILAAILLGLGLAGLSSASVVAQVAPLTLSTPHSMRVVTGPNILGRYLPGDVLRLGVAVNASTEPTIATATNGAVDLTLPYAGAAILEDLYQIEMPYEVALAGPWTFTLRRGPLTASATAPGAPAFAPPLLEALDVTPEGVLSWRWPDLGAAAEMNLRVEADIRAMQEDNTDEFLIRYGLDPDVFPPGPPGEAFSVQLPPVFEEDKLFVLRVHLTFYDADGNTRAQSITFAPRLFAP